VQYIIRQEMRGFIQYTLFSLVFDHLPKTESCLLKRPKQNISMILMDK